MDRHRLSVELLTYLFKNIRDTSDFWTLIEKYFLGFIPEEVMNNYFVKKDQKNSITTAST